MRPSACSIARMGALARLLAALAAPQAGSKMMAPAQIPIDRLLKKRAGVREGAP